MTQPQVEHRIPLRQAEPIASALMRHLGPATERIEIAGSIRRTRQFVKDIELVVIPKWEERVAEGAQATLDVPAPVERVNLLKELIEQHPTAITPIKTGTKELIPWELKPDGRYWRLWLPRSAIKVDVFIVRPENWGWGLLIRTGPAYGPSQSPKDGFTPAMIERWKQVSGGGQSHDMMLHLPNDTPVVTPDEADVFRLCKVRYIAPEARFGANDVKVNALS